MDVGPGRADARTRYDSVIHPFFPVAPWSIVTVLPPNLKLTVTLEAAPEGGISPQTLEETRAALRDLGLSTDIRLE